MWLFVAFDLPVVEKEDRKNSTRFKKELEKLGFSMFQFSLYAYYLTSKNQAETISNKIQKIVPLKGHVTIFSITDKQFGMIRNFFGGKYKELKEPEQALLFE